MATIRDNEFMFNMDGLTEVSFSEREHKFTDGQPYEGVFSINAYSGLVVKAGRKGSKAVAEWFNQQNRNASIARSLSDFYPSELNFAVKGVLTLTVGEHEYVSPEICIAQGHVMSNNNWWIGSPHMKAIKWNSRGTVDLEDEIKAAMVLIAGVATKNYKEAAEGAVGTIKALVNLLTPNNVGTGLLIFTRTSDQSLHLFALKMGNSDTTVQSLGPLPL